MTVRLLRDIFLTGGQVRHAGDLVKVSAYGDKLYIEYRTCCTKGKRELVEGDYEIPQPEGAPEQPASPSAGEQEENTITNDNNESNDNN